MTLQNYINQTLHTQVSSKKLSNESFYLFGETFTEDWDRLLVYYTLPPCHTCTHEYTSLSFGIGSAGSGVQWHFHGPGFSETLHGRKHWVLYNASVHNNVVPDFDPDLNSRHWMEEVYPRLYYDDDLLLPWECTVNAGEMIYFPNGWHHATLNLDRYNVFVSSFTTEDEASLRGSGGVVSGGAMMMEL